MKRVGLATALQNYGQWADGFPEVPSFDDLPHNQKVQSALDTARGHMQNVFDFASSNNLDSENTLDLESASNGEWDTPYGVDDMPDLERTTEHRSHVTELSHNYAVETLGTVPDFDTTSGHLDTDIVNKGGTIKGSNATNDGNAIVEKKKAAEAFAAIYMNQRLRDQTREQTRLMLEQLKATREFLSNMSEESLDTNNMSARAIREREELQRHLDRHGLDYNDYVGEDGIIDRQRMDDDLAARQAELDNANNDGHRVVQASASTEINSADLMGTPVPTQAFNVASNETDGNDSTASYEIADKDPEVAANEMLAALGFPPASSAPSADNQFATALVSPSDNNGFASVSDDGFTSVAQNDGFSSVSDDGFTSIAQNDGFSSVSDDGFTSIAQNDGFTSVSDDGFTSVADISDDSTIVTDGYDSISVAEAVAATDQPQEASLLPPGEWKTMEISSAFQEQSFATETTLAANDPVYNAEESTYGNSDPAAVVGVKVV